MSDDDIQGKESLFIIMILGSWIAIINRGSYVRKQVKPLIIMLSLVIINSASKVKREIEALSKTNRSSYRI
jgi:hypothetical protein